MPNPLPMKSVRKKGMRAARFSIKKVAGLSIKEFKNTKEAKDAVEKTKDAAKKTKEAVKMAAKEAAKQAAKAPGAKDAAKEAKDAAKKTKDAAKEAVKMAGKEAAAAIAAKEDDAYKQGWADCMAAPAKEDDAYKQGWADGTAAAMPKTPDIPVASKDSCHAAHQYLDGLECVKKHCCGSTLWSCSCCGRTSPRQCWWSNKIPEYWTAV